MKKYILASMLCALGAFGPTATQAQSASSQDSKQTEYSRNNRLAAAAPNSYEGVWQGTLRTSDGTHRVLLDVARRPGSTELIGNMVTSAQFPNSVLVDTFNTEDRHVQLNMRTASSAFVGTSNRAMTEIKGMWSHNGQTVPLTLKRMDLTARNDKGMAYDSQSQTAGRHVGQDNEFEGTPYQHHSDPAFRIGPPRWFPWYEWTPRIGNQEVPYGTYYW